MRGKITNLKKKLFRKGDVHWDNPAPFYYFTTNDPSHLDPSIKVNPPTTHSLEVRTRRYVRNALKEDIGGMRLYGHMPDAAKPYEGLVDALESTYQNMLHNLGRKDYASLWSDLYDLNQIARKIEPRLVRHDQATFRKKVDGVRARIVGVLNNDSFDLDPSTGKGRTKKEKLETLSRYLHDLLTKW